MWACFWCQEKGKLTNELWYRSTGGTEIGRLTYLHPESRNVSEQKSVVKEMRECEEGTTDIIISKTNKWKIRTEWMKKGLGSRQLSPSVVPHAASRGHHFNCCTETRCSFNTKLKSWEYKVAGPDDWIVQQLRWSAVDRFYYHHTNINLLIYFSPMMTCYPPPPK